MERNLWFLATIPVVPQEALEKNKGHLAISIAALPDRQPAQEYWQPLAARMRLIRRLSTEQMVPVKDALGGLTYHLRASSGADNPDDQFSRIALILHILSRLDPSYRMAALQQYQISLDELKERFAAYYSAISPDTAWALDLQGRGALGEEERAAET